MGGGMENGGRQVGRRGEEERDWDNGMDWGLRIVEIYWIGHVDWIVVLINCIKCISRLEFLDDPYSRYP